MRIFMKLLAPVLFRVTYFLFRLPLLKRSRRKHTLVMKMFRYAADNGSTAALSVYGHLLHFRGETTQDKIQGGIYLQRAAEQGDAKAQYQMGRIFEHGFEHYFAVEPSKAVCYYQRAADQHHQLAIKRLIQAYRQGELGVAVDMAQAIELEERLPVLPV